MPKRALLFGSLTVVLTVSPALVVGAGAAPAHRSASSEATNVFFVSAKGGRAIRVTNNAEEAEEMTAYYPSWSPDGRRIVFTEIACDGCRPEIHIIRAKPARKRIWLRPPIGYGLFPRWAPNGRLIAFIGGRGGLYIMRPDGTHKRLIAKSGLAEEGPSWSPDSRRIAFARQETATRWRLYLVKVDGSGLRPLTSGRVPSINPSWSPNGRRIAFAQQHGRWQIVTMNINGRARKQVSDGGSSDTFPVWSPNGRRLAFVRQERSRAAVFSMSATGRDVRRLSPRSLLAVQPAWSPDGRRIAFVGA